VFWNKQIANNCRGFGMRFEATKRKPYWLFGEALARKSAPKGAAKMKQYV
jgi:hypothetical protein